MGDSKAVRLMLASYALKEKLSQQDLDLVEIEDALVLVSGNDSRKVHSVVDMNQEGAAVVQAKLEDAITEFDELYRSSNDDLMLKLLTDYSRFRLHLKYYRFAHRVFNRLSVITNPEKIHLAKAGGNLYRLLTSNEVKPRSGQG